MHTATTFVSIYRGTLLWHEEAIQHRRPRGISLQPAMKLWAVTLSSVIADAPKKAMIKPIRPHSGYYVHDEPPEDIAQVDISFSL